MTKQSEQVAHNELVGAGQTSLHSHAGGGGGLVDKGGIVTTDGAGEASVSFNTSYSDTNYFIILTAAENSDAYMPLVIAGTKAVDGFSINTREDKGGNEPNVDVYWCTGPYSNP